MRRLDELTAQTSYTQKLWIETSGDLYADRKKTEDQYEKLKAQRIKLQNRTRMADPGTRTALRWKKPEMPILT